MIKFSKKANTRDNLPPDKEYPFEKVIVDADTPLFRSSKFVQEDYIIVTHKASGREKEFPNKTSFYGHWKKKDGGWLKEVNQQREENNQKTFSVDDFEIEENVRLIPDIEDHVEEGVKIFDYFIGDLKKQQLAPEYILCVGGEGNFRYNIAKTLPYKGNRPDKPLLFESIRDKILDKYKRHIEVVDKKEAEDRLAEYGKENALHYKKTGKWKYCLAYIDKDLDCIVSPSVNYDNYDRGIKYQTPLEAVRALGKQLLIGDLSTDNIKGLPNLTEELREKYKIRKGKGLGETTAINYLKDCETQKEILERVIEAYRAYYGDEPFEHKCYDGSVEERTWLDMLQEVFLLVFISPYEPPEDAHIKTWLDKLGIEY